MDERIARVAALANAAFYDAEVTRRYIDGSPHIKHSSLRSLYAQLVIDIYDLATKHTSTPRLLDLGAGEGSVTLPFLELGAKAIAVDISKNQLNKLRAKCAKYGQLLEVVCGDANEILELLKSRGMQYDIIVANSFLHHVPDYLSLIRKAIALLPKYGQFFSFQDPLRYDSVGQFTYTVSNIAYLSWRIFKGDLTGGVKRRIRRYRGIYLRSNEDTVEYHAIRKGVDQDVICQLLQCKYGFKCTVLRYFSTQSRLWQLVGEKLGLKNTFAIIAQKCL